MRYVNEILNGKKLDDFISSAGRKEILELRVSAAQAIVAEKMLRDDGDNSARRRRYIGFLSAVIQECDKSVARKKRERQVSASDFMMISDEYELFRAITKNVIGVADYEKILKIMQGDK